MRGLLLVVAVLLGLGCYEGGERPLTDEDFLWTSEGLTGASLRDDGQGVLVSSAGSIYRTRDFGATWRRVYANPDHSFRDVVLADAQFGWAIGERAILRTDSGGVLWFAQSEPGEVKGASLRRVAGIDRNRAVVVADGGRWLLTDDGGDQWQRSFLAESGSAGTELVEGSAAPEVGLSCRLSGAAKTSPIDCLSSGPESGLIRSGDGGQSWEPVGLRPPREQVAFVFSAGAPELSFSARAELTEIAQWVKARGAIQVRIDPRVTPDEVESIGRQRDPEALFEILAARTLDVKTLFEEAGLPAGAIVETGTPPWGFADYLDDDPEFLNRYWRSRESTSPSVRVDFIDRARVRSIDSAAGVGLASDGLILRRDAAEGTWFSEPFLAAGEDEAQEMEFIGAEGWALLSSGRLLRSADGGGTWAHAGRLALSPSEGASSETSPGVIWRGLAFSADGSWGIAFGDDGHLSRRTRDTPHWTPVLRALSAD